MGGSVFIAILVGTVVLLTATALWWLLRSPSELEAPEADEPTAGPSLASRFFIGLARSRSAFADALARASEKEGDERFQDLEDALIATDVGVNTALSIVEELKAASGPEQGPDALREQMRACLVGRLGSNASLASQRDGPTVILMVGVNGSGKTTTIGKLAHRYTQAGAKVLLAAGDTFRAGAIEQLKVWGERVGVPVIAHKAGSDPAAVLYDGIQAGVARGMDVVICDTAGRLQAHGGLMDELGKVVRVMNKALPGCPHEVLLVLDATIGQNALSQAKIFKDVVGVTGVVLTKLDGTARGGVVVAVKADMGLPVKLVGLGEGMDDLHDFHAQAFVDALLADSPAV